MAKQTAGRRGGDPRARRAGGSRGKRRIRIGVIGLGRIGWDFHCAQIAQHDEFELVGVADPEAERIAEAERVYGCAGFADYRELLAMPGIDAVAICSPTHLHHAMSVAALEGGLHVFLEKPMAMDVGEAEAIVDCGKRCRRTLTVNQPHRAKAYYRQVRSLIASGRIGELYHVRIGRFRFVRRDDWQSLRKYGGGMLNNYGAHSIDQLLGLIGYDVRKLFGNLRRVASLGDAEDVVKLLVENRTGVLGEVDINQASPIDPYFMTCWGSRGAIQLKNMHEIELSWIESGDLAPKQLDRKLASADRSYPSDDVPVQRETIAVDPAEDVDLYTDFARAIRKRIQPYIKAKEVLEVMRVMERCRKDSGKIFCSRLA